MKEYMVLIEDKPFGRAFVIDESDAELPEHKDCPIHGYFENESKAEQVASDYNACI